MELSVCMTIERFTQLVHILNNYGFELESILIVEIISTNRMVWLERKWQTLYIILFDCIQWKKNE